MSVAPFEIQSSLADGVHRLSVVGELDLASSPVLVARLDPLAVAGMPVEIDLGGVSFIDACGLRVLLNAHELLNAAGAPGLDLVNASRAVGRLCELTGMSERLTGGGPAATD